MLSGLIYKFVFTSVTILALFASVLPVEISAQDSSLSQVGLTVVAAPSGPDITTTSTVFQDIPDMSAGIITDANSNLKITFSGEASTTGSNKMFVRALVDGTPADPSDVILATGSFKVSRSFTFIKANMGAGGHWIEIQWMVDSGGTASIGDRTLTLFSPPLNMSDVGLEVKAAPSGPDVTTTSLPFVDIPDMDHSISTGSVTDLGITFSAEASTAGGQGMFVRALVDGTLADPSDVLFVKGGFTGSRSFTFVRKGLPAGGHSVQIQWSVDPGGTGRLGDRTLSLAAARQTTINGGLFVEAAPSGPNATTTSTSFVDVPGMTATIGTPAQSKLEVTFSGEAFASGSSSVFVRALIDGVTVADPSDVKLASGASAGISSCTFTKENLGGSGHTVQIQWHVDPSGTASLGDRTLGLNYWRAQVPDLTAIYDGGNQNDGNLRPVVGSRNLLVILWDPHRIAPDEAPAASTIDDLVFGPRPSVRDYYLENSGGRFNLQRTNVLGWYNADIIPGSYYWSGTDPTDADGDGFKDPQVRKWWEALRDADADFNFKNYDVNNDGYLSPSELGILIVIPQAVQAGFNRKAVAKEFPAEEPLIVDGVKIELIAEAFIQSNTSIHRGLVAHELAHLLLGGRDGTDKEGAADMYFNSFSFPYEAGPYSLMDDSPPFSTHLDPFHKLRVGWIAPRVVTVDGWYKIRDVETNNEAFILYDPARGNKEYFIVENRWLDSTYDSATLGFGLPDTGIAIWHIIEDPAVFNALPPPTGVSAADWATTMTQWGRRAVRLIRPVYAPATQNQALWDGSDPTTGYDLLSVDADPSHVTLKWADGTPSGFAIQAFSASGPEMEVYFGTNFKSLPSVITTTGKGRVHFDATVGVITSLVAMNVMDVPKPPPVGTDFRFGLFALTVMNVPPGGTTAVTLAFPEVLGPGTGFWVFGPSPSNPVPDWHQLPSTINGNKLTLMLTDGGIGDSDHVADGTIRITAGPSASPPVAVPGISVLGMLALALSLAMLTVWLSRKRPVGKR